MVAVGVGEAVDFAEIRRVIKTTTNVESNPTANSFWLVLLRPRLLRVDNRRFRPFRVLEVVPRCRGELSCASADLRRVPLAPLSSA